MQMTIPQAIPLQSKRPRGKKLRNESQVFAASCPGISCTSRTLISHITAPLSCSTAELPVCAGLAKLKQRNVVITLTQELGQHKHLFKQPTQDNQGLELAVFIPGI